MTQKNKLERFQELKKNMFDNLIYASGTNTGLILIYIFFWKESKITELILIAYNILLILTYVIIWWKESKIRKEIKNEK